MNKETNNNTTEQKTVPVLVCIGSNNQNKTEDKLQTEEELAKYNDILKGYPKTKTYIRQVSLIYPTSKKSIEKLVNARETIEHHFSETYEQNIIYGINQCFRFNKSRPSPAQVIAMITGDSVADLKQKELNKNKETENEVNKIKQTKEKFNNLKQEAFDVYRKNPVRRQIYRQSQDSLEILDELMRDFMSMQALILSFVKAGIRGHGIGLSKHLSKISAREDGKLGKLWESCFTMYIRSKSFYNLVIRNNRVGTEIPTAFINYVEELRLENERYNREQNKQYNTKQNQQYNTETNALTSDSGNQDYEIDSETKFRKLDFKFLTKTNKNYETRNTANTDDTEDCAQTQNFINPFKKETNDKKTILKGDFYD